MIGCRVARMAAFCAFFAVPAGALYESAGLPAAPSPLRAPIIVDPGHGGEDMGAVVRGKREKDIVLAIAQKVRARLQELGTTPVRLTRESDVFVPLDRRVVDSIETQAAAFISLHVDQVRSRSARGIRVFAFGKNPLRYRGRKKPRSKVAPLPPPPPDEAKASNELAAALVRSMRAQGFRVEPPAKAGFYVLKNPRIPSVLIELGYISNPQEARQLSDPEYQQRLAEAIAVSIESHLASASPVEPDASESDATVLASDAASSSGASR